MATRIVHSSYIQVIGPIWMPQVTCAMQYDIGEWEVGNMITLDREGVSHWLSMNSGDFRYIIDFYANIWNHFDKCDVEIQWSDPESEYTFNQCMYPSED